MSELHFDTEEEAFRELERFPPGAWVAEEREGKWVIRPKTFSERSEEKEFARRAVTVTFSTTVDLAVDEMTDEDWIDLGKMVAEVAASARVGSRVSS